MSVFIVLFLKLRLTVRFPIYLLRCHHGCGLQMWQYIQIIYPKVALWMKKDPHGAGPTRALRPINLYSRVLAY
uniref:Secreted protein n=1 Tax=Rhizophora mucronata TaxID=61149 RepID=A0A2P2NQX6_RHIMU